jgi:mediator of RNA polymerase II transcription subunit 12, fungi type
VLPEILLLAEAPDPEAPSILANSLWYKYRTAHDWAWKVWDNTVASLRQIPVLTADIASRRSCALRYGNFLLHVDEHLPGGLDAQVLQWFFGPGRGEVVVLNADAWDVLTVVILYLSIHGALKTTTVLRGLVYPAWQLGASVSVGHQGQPMETFLHAANLLFELLLLRKDSGDDDMPPADLHDFQRICTRRQEVYREPHFSYLVATIPTLILVERSEYISENLRQASRSLRLALCEDKGFRQGAHRNLDAVREAFEQPLQSDTISEQLRDPLVEALRLVLCESEQSWYCLLGLMGLTHTASFQRTFQVVGKIFLPCSVRGS